MSHTDGARSSSVARDAAPPRRTRDRARARGLDASPRARASRGGRSNARARRDATKDAIESLFESSGRRTNVDVADATIGATRRDGAKRRDARRRRRNRARGRRERGAGDGEGAIRFRKPFENLNFERDAERRGPRGERWIGDGARREIGKRGRRRRTTGAGARRRGRGARDGSDGRGRTDGDARSKSTGRDGGWEGGRAGARTADADGEARVGGRWKKRELDARGVVDAETGEFDGERAGVEGERDDDGFGVERARRAGAASRGEANAQEAVERVR